MQYKNMEGTNMKKFVCQVCGYVYEGEAAPAKCPQCGAPASKFQEMAAEMGWAAEHVVGVASDVPEDIKAVAVFVLAHRLVLSRGVGSQSTGTEIIEKLLSDVAVPTENWGKHE